MPGTDLVRKMLRVFEILPGLQLPFNEVKIHGLPDQRPVLRHLLLVRQGEHLGEVDVELRILREEVVVDEPIPCSQPAEHQVRVPSPVPLRPASDRRPPPLRGSRVRQRHTSNTDGRWVRRSSCSCRSRSRSGSRIRCRSGHGSGRNRSWTGRRNGCRRRLRLRSRCRPRRR